MYDSNNQASFIGAREFKLLCTSEVEVAAKTVNLVPNRARFVASSRYTGVFTLPYLTCSPRGVSRVNTVLIA